MRCALPPTSSGRYCPSLLANRTYPWASAASTARSALGWRGERNNQGFLELLSKLEATVPPAAHRFERTGKDASASRCGTRPCCCRHSPSRSHRTTQVNPLEGVELLNELLPAAVLVSAYDAAGHGRNKMKLRSAVKRLSKSSSVVVLDSGNYEAYGSMIGRARPTRVVGVARLSSRRPGAFRLT